VQIRERKDEKPSEKLKLEKKINPSTNIVEGEKVIFVPGSTHTVRRPNSGLGLHGPLSFQARRKSCTTSTESPVLPSQTVRNSSKFIGHFPSSILLLSRFHIVKPNADQETQRRRWNKCLADYKLQLKRLAEIRTSFDADQHVRYYLRRKITAVESLVQSFKEKADLLRDSLDEEPQLRTELSNKMISFNERHQGSIVH
jgi:hypothetical protein